MIYPLLQQLRKDTITTVRFLLSFLVFIQFMTTMGEQDISKLNPMKVRRAFLEKVTPGKLVHFQMEVNLEEGFFAYQNQFKLKVNQPENSLVGELFISPIVEFDDAISKKQKKGIKDSATITTQIQIPEDLEVGVTNTLDIRLTYIACTKKFCLTPRFINFKIPIVWNIQEKPKTGITGFLQGIESRIEGEIKDHFILSLFWVFFFGFLTSLTPCVYPLIPITLTILGGREKKSRWNSFLVSLFYVFGIAITYAFLGLVAAQTGQLFGSLISHPAVMIVISLILFAMGLSLLGLFEIQAPAFIRNSMANRRIEKNYLSVFISGLLAGVIASPCVGPVLVGILAYIAHHQDSFLGFVLLFTFAMGFGSLFILLGTFQLTDKLPRSGQWMKGVKILLAFCLFGLSFYYSWPLLKKQQSESELSKTAKKFKKQPRWQKYTTQKVEEAKKQGRPVIIDFYADWCLSCTELDELTFSQPEVIERSPHFTMIKVDATSPSKELKKITDQYEVYGLPTIIFINSKGEVLKDLTLTGFEKASLFTRRMDQLID